MRAMQITALGTPLVATDLPVPVPGPGQALIRVHACGVNFADTLMRAGTYQEKHPLPFVPGMEVCGTVEALGPPPSAASTGPDPDAPQNFSTNVAPPGPAASAATEPSGPNAAPGASRTSTAPPGSPDATPTDRLNVDTSGGDGLAVGTRVACFPGHGGFAEYLLAPAGLCVPVPATMPDAQAAGFLVAYGTSHLALDYRARLRPGETLLVLGAAGGIGLTAVEIGKLMGARVIASARGADKLALAKAAGADHLVDADEDLRSAVKALGGADVVYDPVGGPAFDAALRAANPGARLLPLGFASGTVPQIPANILLVKNLTVHGLYWGGTLKLDPAAVTGSIATLFRWYAEGRLRPHVSHILPLEEANTALDLLTSRRATGKVVLTMAG